MEKDYFDFDFNIKLDEDKILKAIQRITDEAVKKFIPIYKAELEKLFRKTVDDFYAGYSRTTYKPRNSLRNILKIEADIDGTESPGLNISFMPEKMSAYERSEQSLEDGLYSLVFREGWHGGAKDGEDHPKPGTPYWRTLPGFRDWYKVAERAKTSPLDDFKDRVAEYEDGEGAEKLKEIFNTLLKEDKELRRCLDG